MTLRHHLITPVNVTGQCRPDNSLQLQNKTILFIIQCNGKLLLRDSNIQYPVTCMQNNLVQRLQMEPRLVYKDDIGAATTLIVFMY